MTTQIEQIEWHSADEKPARTDWYLIDEGDDGVDRIYWGDTTWHYCRWETVIAWAELPKGWKE